MEKVIRKIIENENIINLISNASELDKYIKSKCFTIYEEKEAKKELKQMINRIKEILKEV